MGSGVEEELGTGWHGFVDAGSEESVVMGRRAGAGGEGAWRVERQIAHSRSETEAVSAIGVDGSMLVFTLDGAVVVGTDVPSLDVAASCSFVLTSRSFCMFDGSATSVSSFKRSLASALLSAGFLTLRVGVGSGVFRCRRLTQNTHRNGAKKTTTNTGTRNANAVGVMPELPTVFRHSLLSSPIASCCDNAGITQSPSGAMPMSFRYVKWIAIDNRYARTLALTFPLSRG